MSDSTQPRCKQRLASCNIVCEETPHASPCNVQWVLLWQVDTKRAAVFELQAVENPDRCFPSYSMLWSFTSCPGSDNEVLLAGSHRLSFQSCSIYFLLHADLLSTVPILKSLQNDLKKVAELGSIFRRPSCFLKSKCFPLGPRQGPLPCPLCPWKLFTSDCSGSMSGTSGATLQQPGHKWWFVWWIEPQNWPTCLFCFLTVCLPSGGMPSDCMRTTNC